VRIASASTAARPLADGQPDEVEVLRARVQVLEAAQQEWDASRQVWKSDYHRLTLRIQDLE
jgi:hypothetical protein